MCVEAQMLRSHDFQFQIIFQNFIFRIAEKEALPSKTWASGHYLDEAKMGNV